MALIKCPNCGKEISDKAIKCVECGYELSAINKEKDLQILCSECGTYFDANLDVCPNCGCPVEKQEEVLEEPIAKEQEKPKKKRKTGLIIFLVILVAAGLFAKVQIDKYKFDSNSREVASLMTQGGMVAEEICGQVHSVWYNCMFEEKDKDTNKFTRKNSGKGEFYSDFNDALDNLYNDEDFISKCEELGTNMRDVVSLMQKLTNPPKGFEMRYDSLLDMYETYYDFATFALNGSGYTLKEYTDKFNDLDRDAANKIEGLVLYFE